MGLHSSTMMELEAISIGLQLMDILYKYSVTISTLHIVIDSQAALMALIGGANTTGLVVTRGVLRPKILKTGKAKNVYLR